MRVCVLGGGGEEGEQAQTPAIRLLQQTEHELGFFANFMTLTQYVNSNNTALLHISIR